MFASGWGDEKMNVLKPSDITNVSRLFQLGVTEQGLFILGFLICTFLKKCTALQAIACDLALYNNSK